jgi:hypothetical protein
LLVALYIRLYPGPKDNARIKIAQAARRDDLGIARPFRAALVSSLRRRIELHEDVQRRAPGLVSTP